MTEKRKRFLNHLFLKLRRGSVPLKNLIRLALWRKITKAESIVVERIITVDWWKIIAETGKDKAANIEEIETILSVIKITSQIKSKITNGRIIPGIFAAKATRTPIVVATPLPPLKPKNIVQLWPKMQLNPKIILINSEGRAPVLRITRSPRKNTAAKPLKISNNKTVIPAFFPSNRKAFVAPTLPEPNLRISAPFKHLPKI